MIDWSLLLGTIDLGPRLQALYDNSPSMNALADHLGVSKNALTTVFKRYSVRTRIRGGPHPSFRKDLIPVNAADLTAAQIAKLTGYTHKYCEKLLAQLHKGVAQRSKGDTT